MRSLLVCAAVLLGPVARATPLLDRHIGGMVFVGPTSPHVSGLYWNPATIGLLSGQHILVLGSARLDFTTIQRATISSSDGEPSPAGDRSFAEQSPVYATPGGFAGFISAVGQTNLTIGGAAFMPFADQLPDLDPTLGYHALGGSIYGQATTLGLAYRAASWFYAGLTFGALFTKVDLRFLRDTALDACAAPPCSVEDAAKAERWSLSTEWNAVIGLNFDAAFWVGAGVLMRLWGVWIGISATFPGLLSGDIGKNGDVEVLRPDGTTAAGRGRLSFRLPLFVHMGLRKPISGKLELLINASYSLDSVHDAIDLRLFGRDFRDTGLPEWVVRHRGLQDVFSVEAGVEQPPATTPVRLGARLRFESSSVPRAELAPDRVNAAKLELAVGAELRVTTHLAFTASGATALDLPADVAQSTFMPRAAIDCTASGYDLITPACTAAREGRAIPTAAGSYRRLGAQLALGIAVDWW